MSTTDDQGEVLMSIYDVALPEVFGYLLRRCRNRATAEDLTTEVFLAAVESVRRRVVTDVTIPWLIGIARHKLIDHWRRSERDERNLRAVGSEPVPEDDPWDAWLDEFAARDVLGELGGHHRAALTLRYVDDLPVPEVADLMGRTVHATEALLVRARKAFRARYEEVAP
ncbi:MAG: sigma-70 family RNA polymerase sigma factor [Acidimicrobiia bacterium]|nr:sigma-70 family RNA polymerase sigma factor [Acidimicrobiia bacterium]